MDDLAVCRADEAVLAAPVELPYQWVIVAAQIGQQTRLTVNAQLYPGNRLAELLERSEASRQRDEAVGEFGHQGLALVHGADDAQVADAAVRQLAVFQL